MKSFIERAWQHGHILMWLLWPLMILYWMVIRLRKFAYRVGLLSSVKLPLPVIIVGNITVGGNGKTPMVVWLAENLTEQGYHVGIISRGYGGSAQGVMLVDNTTPVALSGDEPKLIVRKTGCLMAIGRDRIAAAQLVIDTAMRIDKPLDVIISDDGLQHYRLRRDIEIAIVDGARRFGNGKLLPMGPLRETQSRLSEVDIVICNGGARNGGSSNFNEESLTLVPGAIVQISGGKEFVSDHFNNKEVVAMAGIGYPQRFFDTLAAIGIKTVDEIPFADHQAFEVEQLKRLTAKGQCLLMTEKDAVKCQDFAKDNWYYLPVTAEITPAAKEKIFNKLKEAS